MRVRTKVAAVTLTALAVFGGGMAVAGALSGDQPNRAPDAGNQSSRLLTPTVSETSFVPISPCRIADTRKAGGPLQIGASRAFTVRGTQQFVPQGGTSGGCKVPAGASSVSVSISAVDPGGSGFIRAYPAGGTPDATVLNYQSGQDISVTSTIKLASNATAKPLSLRAYGTATQVTLDVVGYFTPPMAGLVELNGTLGQTTGRVLSSSRVSLGTYQVTFDRSLTGCSLVATPFAFNHPIAVAATTGTTATVFIHTEAAPDVYYDSSFHIVAAC